MRKQIIKLSIVLLAIFMVSVYGCKKEDLPSKTVKVSQPTINLVGDPVVILHVGDTYVDAGATYYDSLYGDNGTLTTSTEISTAEEGFFIVTYSAKNQYGFEGSGTRLVAVTEADDALDVSGDYARTANGVVATVSKVGRGVFQTSNAGGNGFEDAAYFMFKGDSTMVMPSQYLVNSVAQATFIDPYYDFTATPLNYSYAIDAAGYGTSVRVFEKQ